MRINRLIALLLCCFTFNATARVLSGTDTVSTLPFWEWRSEKLSIRLIQRLPDQTRAYFMARGFTARQAEVFAQSCVFQTIVKNTTSADQGQEIRYDLSQWIVMSAGKKRGLITRQAWQKIWKTKNIEQASLIALNWSLLPTEHRYQADDFNWGMSMYGLPPGLLFNLQLVWYENDEKKSVVIKDIECAPDTHPDPEIDEE